MTKKTKKKRLTAMVLFLLALTPQTVTAQPSPPRDNKIKYHTLSYEEELMQAKEKLSLGDTSHVTRNLVLPQSYGVHVSISWESSDEALIDTTGKTANPTDKEKTVVLIARLTSSMTDKTESASFNIILPKLSAEEILENDARTVQEYVDYILNTGYKLPDKKELDIRSDIKWELTEGSAEIKEEKLVKTKASEERQQIALKATLSYEGQTKAAELSQIMLLDEYAGYILSYFAGVNESKEMYIGYSYDGIHWMRLNEGNAVLTPKKGNKQIRDPFIMRKKDGSFAIFATNGWNSDCITIWDSKDLTSYENERLLKVTEKGYKGLNGFFAWAPECNYDPITGLYYIYWSDPKTGKTWYNTSADLTEASMPDILYEANTEMIDASIKKYKGDYYMVYNDAYGNNEGLDGGKMIYGAKADSLEAGAFYPYWGALSEPIAEGPFLLYDFKKDNWIAYFDYYSEHQFGMNTIENINDDNWVYKGISTTMPSEELRHGGAIPVTQKELDCIIKAWGTDLPELLSLEEIPPITVQAKEKDWIKNLPKTAAVLLSDGRQTELPIAWNTDASPFDEKGEHTLTGELKKANYANSESLKAIIVIHVTESSNALLIILIICTAGAILILSAVLLLVRKKHKKSLENKAE